MLNGAQSCVDVKMTLCRAFQMTDLAWRVTRFRKVDADDGVACISSIVARYEDMKRFAGFCSVYFVKFVASLTGLEISAL